MPLSEVENVILIGMMGSGKSTLGKQLARRLRRPFFDSDLEVTRRAGVDIPLIFDLEGESGFRARETEALADLLKQTGIVLATGGGAVVRAENRALLRDSGLVVYLHAAVGVLHERTRHAKGRPLLAVEDPLQRLTELYSARDPLYRATAHLVVESDQNRVSALLNRVVQGLEKLSRRPPLRNVL